MRIERGHLVRATCVAVLLSLCIPATGSAATGEIEAVMAHFTGFDHKDIRAYGAVKLTAGRTYGIEAVGLIAKIRREGLEGESVRDEDPMFCVRSTYLGPCQTNEEAISLRMALVAASQGAGRPDVHPEFRGFADFAGLAVPGRGGPNHQEVPYTDSHLYKGSFKPTVDSYLYVLVRGLEKEWPDVQDPNHRVTGQFTVKITGDTSAGGGGGGGGGGTTGPKLPASPSGKGPNVNAAFSTVGAVTSSADANVKEASLKGVCGLRKPGARRGRSFKAGRSFGTLTYRDTSLDDDLLGEPLSLGIACTGGGSYSASGGTAREVTTFKVRVTRSSDSEDCTEGETGTLTVTRLARGTDKLALSLRDCDRSVTWTDKTKSFGLRIQAQRR